MSTTPATAVPALVIRRTFNASPERVFDAWSTPGALMQWFAPPGCSMQEAAFDAREGGAFRLAMIPSHGELFVARGTVVEFRRPERLAFTFTWEEDDSADEHETVVRIDLAARGAQTEMTFTHERLASEESRARHNEGWSGSIGHLAAYVESPARIGLRGIDLSGYMCKDAKRAIAFYRDLFGLEPSLVYPDDRGAEFELPDGTTFGLWGGGGRVMPFQPSNGILFAVDDLDAALTALASRDIPVHYQTETPMCRMAMIADSEGNTLTLHQRKV